MNLIETCLRRIGLIRHLDEESYGHGRQNVIAYGSIGSNAVALNFEIKGISRVKLGDTLLTIKGMKVSYLEREKVFAGELSPIPAVIMNEDLALKVGAVFHEINHLGIIDGTTWILVPTFDSGEIELLAEDIGLVRIELDQSVLTHDPLHIMNRKN